MKKSITFIFALIWIISAMGAEWITINSNAPKAAEVQLISSDVSSSEVEFRIDGFYLNEVKTKKGNAFTVSLEEGSSVLREGEPDLAKLTASLMIPDLDNMEFEIISSEYQDFSDIEIAPSKGNLTRDINPDDVAYTWGKTYEKDQFYPGKMADLRNPYIIRDYRGQTLVVYPFQYNPVKKTLRVYHSIKIKVKSTGKNGINPLIRQKELTTIDNEFSKIYAHHFLNYDNTDYTPVGEIGNMLVISYGSFMADMQPFVDWKNTIGIPTEMVNVATIGNSSAIKTYIANYYNTNGLTFVLLVGDAAQIPSSYASGDSDNDYSYVVGGDHYPDLFVGRFSAENTSHVQTQVQRTIDYEQNPTTGYDWYTKCIGLASQEGPGDDNEYDYQHIRNMTTDLLAYTYTYNYELFEGSQGGNDAFGNPTAAMVDNDINSGASVLLYTGHGSNTSFVTSGFNSTNVNALTNNGKLPFIWAVACVNGNFVSTTCFAEAWMRATSNNEPSGSVATLMSTINQSWNPPMEGQDEMVDILVESYGSNIKRTFGGISMNGCMKMNDTYGSAGDEMTDTWNCFGDPSLMVRTAVPQTMVVTHNPVILLGSTQFTVNCDAEGALVCLTINNQIIGTAYVSGGSATVNFNALTNIETVTIAVTAYNYIPYIGTADVVPASGPFVSYLNHQINDISGNNNGEADFGENITLHITLENVGSSPAYNVSAILSSTNPYVTITDNTQAWGTINDGTTSTQNNAFAVTIANNVPDQTLVSFDLDITGDSDDIWSSSFSITINAPSFTLGNLTIDDSSGGNGNGSLDPGETVNITIGSTNTGHAASSAAVATLATGSPYITINTGTQNYSSIGVGSTVYPTFNVTIGGGTPTGTNVSFNYILGAGNYSASDIFSETVGQIPVLILNFDPNNNSAPSMQAALNSLGVSYETHTTFPADLDLYASVFVCLGIYSSNHVLSSGEGTLLANYLNSGGRLYMEGGDTWAYDASTAIHSMFNIVGESDGTGDMGTVVGMSGTFTAGMSFSYSGENNWMDRLVATAPAFVILQNQSPVYGTGIAYDAGTYKTIGSSHEFGGLNDGSLPSTKEELMYQYLDFFGLVPPEQYSVSLTVFLEGPFNVSSMKTELIALDDFPLSQPFYNLYGYNGGEAVGSIPNPDIVDWVLVELRDANAAMDATPGTWIANQAGFVLNDGSVVGVDGSNPMFFDEVITHGLYVIIYTRNHLAVLSASELIGGGGIYSYDFSTGIGQAYGNSAGYKYLGSNIWGMVSGDGNCDGEVTLLDEAPEWEDQAGEAGYNINDHNMDGQVDNQDKDGYLLPNEGKGCQVPE